MKKVAILFPGQGSQYVGMGQELYNEHELAKQVFEEANESLGFDLKKLCFEGNLDELTLTANCQPAILTVSVAMYRVHQELLHNIPTPNYMAGNSLGEYSALVCSGVLSFSDALKIVRKRGEFMQEAVKEGIGAMMAINGLEYSQVKDFCDEESADHQIVQVSAFNNSTQVVISGHKDIVEKMGGIFTKAGATAVSLKVSAPYHSPLMRPAALGLTNELKEYAFNSSNCPLVANVNGLPYQYEEDLNSKLTDQLTHPVLWKQSMDYLLDNNVHYFIEVGPGKKLRNLLSEHDNIEAYSLDDSKDLPLLKESLSNTIPSMGTLLTKSLAIAVSVRNTNWNNEEYELGVVVPYKKIASLQEKLEEERRLPTKEEMNEAVQMLISVFKTKGVTQSEQTARFDELFKYSGMHNVFSVN